MADTRTPTLAKAPVKALHPNNALMQRKVDGEKSRRPIPPARIDLAEKMYLQGMAPRDIGRTLSARFGVTERQARRYLDHAQARIARRPPISPEAAVARSENLLLHTYKLAESLSDVRTMATCAVRLVEIHGRPQKHEHSGPNGAAIPVSVLHGVVALPTWGETVQLPADAPSLPENAQIEAPAPDLEATLPEGSKP